MVCSWVGDDHGCVQYFVSIDIPVIFAASPRTNT